MTKTPDRNIASPAPTKGQGLDTAELERMLRERCQFDGDDTATLHELATEWAVEVGVPVKQAVTVAWRVYRKIDDEEGEKR